MVKKQKTRKKALNGKKKKKSIGPWIPWAID
jgi:hypothetical protein